MRRAVVALVTLLFAAITDARAASIEDRVAELRLPAGFSMEVYVRGVANARQLALSPRGTLFIGSRREGKVYAARDTDADGHAEQVHLIAEDLYMPSGVAFRDGDLFVAEVNRILRFRDIEQRLATPTPPEVVYDSLPSDAHHGWKFIAFGPDGWLYVPIGAPCNVCDRAPPYASIIRLDPGSGRVASFARGVRNSVGFDWHPVSGELWFTDNGRDWLGDDSPSCELNRAPVDGLHFGFPYVHDVATLDPEFGQDKRPEDFTAPAARLGPHVAPLGVEFDRRGVFGAADGAVDLIVAEHGSWNRSSKSGYRVSRVRVAPDGTAGAPEPLVTGWLLGEEHWGRPVDVEQMPDGSFLISDDENGVVYRLFRGS